MNMKKFNTCLNGSTQLRLHREILITLLHLAPPLDDKNMLPQQATWPTTRQISDAHNISIYKARLHLLELASQRWVIVSDEVINNSLRWYPNILSTYPPLGISTHNQRA